MPSHKAAFGICDSSMIESIKVSRNGAIGLAAFGGDFTRMPWDPCWPCGEWRFLNMEKPATKWEDFPYIHVMMRYTYELCKTFFHNVIFQFRGCFNKFVLGQPQSEWISVLKGLSKSIENRVFHRFFLVYQYLSVTVHVTTGGVLPPFQTDPKKGLKMVERSLSTSWPNKNASSTVRKGVQRCIFDLAQWSGQNVTEFRINVGGK